ncbi:hypothetical protein K7432_006323 [Basidiobolus ranarum]|uniref:ORC6 first cyclin-like domain-containing protein n=1 Tax=Basidiobolus ranarum TaxID=34480 RepID=A0ABR2WV67_9FUNG
MPSILLDIAIVLGLDGKSLILERAQHLLGEMDILLPQLTIPNSKITKPTLCLQLACESLREKFNQRLAYITMKISPSTYIHLLNNIRFILGLDLTSLYRMIRGFPSINSFMLDDIKDIYYAFRVNYSKVVCKTGRLVNWASPKYQYTIVYIYCQLLHPNILKSSLLQQYRLQTPEFDRFLETVKYYTSDTLARIQRQLAPTPYKKRSAPEEFSVNKKERKIIRTQQKKSFAEKSLKRCKRVYTTPVENTEEAELLPLPVQTTLENPKESRVKFISKAMVSTNTNTRK